MNQQEILRYTRQLPLINIEGQKKLKNANILCIGAGGLGCSALIYLASTGIGHIGIVDHDSVELSNLHRQVLYYETDIGKEKAQIAKERLLKINPNIEIKSYVTYFDQINADIILPNYDLIIDATDNFKTRYLINQKSLQHQKPLISASLSQFDAQISLFNMEDGPCYACLFPTEPPSDFIPNCSDGGILGFLPGMVGTLQAAEAIKVILQLGHSLKNRFIIFNTLEMKMNEFNIEKQPDCPVCGYGDKKIKTIIETKQTKPILKITPEDLYDLIHHHHFKPLLIDVRQAYEREICHLDGLHLPLETLKTTYQNIPRKKTIIFYCKTGPRSQKAVEILQDYGFSDLFYLEGGILNWIETIDSSLFKY